MRSSMILFVFILIFLPLFDSYAGTIYSWTDKNGVKKFSNTEPIEEVENLEVLEEMPLSETVDTEIEANVNKLSYEEIVRSGNSDNGIDDHELTHYIKEMEVKKKQEEIVAEEEKSRIADDQFNQKIQLEQERLQGEIDRIEKLAVGKSLSLARKNAMIKQFQDKLDLLKIAPEEYFSTNETE